MGLSVDPQRSGAKRPDETYQPSAATLAWDEAHLKALLRLPRAPARLIHQEPWHSWIVRRGGIKAVHAYLCTCPLPPHQRALLQAVLDQPAASMLVYADRLSISRATYFNHLRDLIAALVQHLNAWNLAPPEPPAANYHAPPARAASPHNLPAPLTPLIGAEQALASVCARLRRADMRLLTITGPGGIGKTRLGICAGFELLADFPDGVFLVPLAAESDPGLIDARVAQALGIPEPGGQPLRSTLREHLRDRQMLLILDNFEHLVAAAALVGELLAAAPHLKVLLTSRAVLHIYGEHVFPVPPLPVPDLRSLPPPEQIAEYASVRLFVARAQAISADFALTGENAAAVAAICARLDALPLAIELAAARIKMLQPQEILARLDQRLALLSGGQRDLPARHQALRRTIEWSYALLDEGERALFRALAVFVNGWTIEAAEFVCGGPLLAAEGAGQSADPTSALLEGVASLLDKSLLQRQGRQGGGPRFEMLETIREYALEQIAAHGEVRALRDQHARYYLALAERAEPELTGPQQVEWVARIDREHDNLRAALRWLLETRASDLALRLTGAVWRFWQWRSYLSEGQQLMEQALAQGGGLRTPARAKTLWGAGWLSSIQGDIPHATELFEASLALFRELGDKRGIGVALHGVGSMAAAQGDHPRARAQFEESLQLFQALGDDEEIGWSLIHLGHTDRVLGDFARSRARFEDSLRRFQALGQAWASAQCLLGLGMGELAQERYPEAWAWLEPALAHFRELGNTWQLAEVLEMAGRTAARIGRPGQARQLLEESLRLHDQVGNLQGLAFAIEGFAELAASEGDGVRAARLCGAQQALIDASNRPLSQFNRDRYAQARVWDAARALLGEERFQAERMRGRALPISQAIDEALGSDLP